GISFWPKFKGRDGCRTPMPWNAELHGGFSKAEPWLPVDPVHIDMNVERQESEAHSTLRFTRAMIALRKARPELHKGSIALLDAPEGVLGFSRTHEGSRIICLFNMGTVQKKVPGHGSSDILLGQHAQSDGHAVMLGVSGFCLLQG
ncbi:MAG TPA: DUF3459 domain-containing protein, partial [Noviherbaspirillum sp.]|nr:DUF3459 domain-containing protein [Noviherbaspirillum sp.]